MKYLNSRKAASTLALCILLSAPMFISCNNTPKDKLDDATTEVVDATEDLVKANDEFMVEVSAYKADVEMKIVENERKLDEYNSDMKIKKTAELKKKVEELKVKTADLRKKLVDFNTEGGKESWAEFKTEFNHDMDELGKALNDLTVKNTTK